MWERMQGVVDGSIVVTLDEVKRAMRIVAEKMRVIAKGRARSALRRRCRDARARGRSSPSCPAAISI
jgi:threonine dehydratase